MTELFLKNYLFTLIPFVALDAVWLGLVAKKFYRSQIGYIMAERPNWIAAAIFTSSSLRGWSSLLPEGKVRCKKRHSGERFSG